ncbi:MAG: DUF6922 domain-containing protein [Rectinemataceae bacterium]
MDSLSPELFWDVRREGIDPETQLRWLIERVVDRGRWKDWLVLKESIPREKMKAVLPRLRLQARERIFLENYLDDSNVG